MTKFKSVLSDEYIDAIVLGSPITIGKSINRSKDFILMIEQAVQAKLAEKGPVAYAAFSDNGNIRIWAGVKAAAEGIPEAGEIKFQPLYAQPMPSPLPAKDIKPTDDMIEAAMEASLLGRPSPDDEAYVMSIISAYLKAAPKCGGIWND